MLRNWPILFLLLFPFFIILAQENNEYAFKGEILQPGTSTSISFKIDNPSIQDKHYILAVVTNNSSIKPLLPSNTISVPAGKSGVFIVPLRIGADTKKGTYLITLETEDNNGRISKITSPMIISMVRKLSVTLADSPEYAKAGDSITISFIAKNNGNMAEKLFLKSAYCTIDAGSEINLLPGQSRVILLKSLVDPNIGAFGYLNYSLNAVTENHPIEHFDSYSNVKVIPTRIIEQDVYERFPISASINYVGRNEQQGFVGGFQGEIFGQGVISNKNNAVLEFRAVTKSPVSFSIFSPYEEYYASYRSRKLYVFVGDKTYNSSFLIDFGRYGRGAELQYKIKKLTVGGFYSHPRFFKEIQDQFNVSAKYDINKYTEVTAGYLYKIPREEMMLNNTHVPYISGKTKIFKNVEVQGEVAYSKNGEKDGLAYNAQVQGGFNKLSAGMMFLKTSADFGGYFNNTTSASANIQYQLNEKIDLSANYREDARNFKRDTIFGAAPYQKYAQFGFQYKYSPKTILNLFGGYQNFDDRMENKQFSYEEYYARASVSQQVGIVNITGETQIGQNNNFLTGQAGKSQIYIINASLEKFRTTFNVFGNYTKSSRYIGEPEGQFYYGARINSRISPKSSLNIFYQNNYAPEQNFGDRNLFEFMYKQQIFRNHQLDLTARYMIQGNSNGNKDLLVSMRYTMRINAPIKKIADLVTLSGTVANLGVKKVEGIRITMGNHITVTDKNGNYTFRNLPKGDYYLDIDRSTIDLNDIANISMPVKVPVMDKENFFNFGLIKAVSIKGFVKVQDNSTIQSDLLQDFDANTERKKSESIIIEVSNGDAVVRKICGLNERFDFTYLQPGSWNVRVYRNGLDKKYKITADNFAFDLIGGESKEVSINISKQQREIKFQQNEVKVSYNTAPAK